MTANRFNFGIAFLLVAACAVVASGAEKPNVVFFLVDDLGRTDCGFMGSNEIKTPQIDRLAAAGAILDAHYVQPVCSPTRAALLTGRYPMRHGLQVGVVRPWSNYGLPIDERTLAQDFQSAGYVTGIFGKWHLGHVKAEYLPTRRGFDRQYGHFNGAIDYFAHEREGGFDWHKDDKQCRDEGYSTTLIGQNAAKFVADNAGKRPFFLYVPFNAVHAPYQAPDKYMAMYPTLKGNRRSYAAMLTATDDAIAEVVGAVEKAGVRDNTLFIFSSDNGGPAPGRITDNGDYRGGKGQLYEGGVRAAAFATWDGHIPAGSTVTEPIHVVDWRPTLQKLCATHPSSDHAMDGRDIWPTLTAGAPSPHDVILLNTSPQSGAVRAGNWKLIVNSPAKDGRPRTARRRGGSGGEHIQLYNLRSDPSEKNNVAKQNPEKVKLLRQKLNGFARQAVTPKGGDSKPANFKSPAVWGEAGG